MSSINPSLVDSINSDVVVQNDILSIITSEGSSNEETDIDEGFTMNNIDSSTSDESTDIENEPSPSPTNIPYIDYGNPIVEPFPSPENIPDNIDEVIEIVNSISNGSSDEAEVPIPGPQPLPDSEPEQASEEDNNEESKEPEEQYAEESKEPEEKVEDEVKQEEKVEDEVKQEEKVEEKECSICYGKLNINNIVNTTCSHVYCKKCFFRWMKSQSNCPMCRRNFVSITTWYQNQDVNAEIDELTLLSENIQNNVVRMRRRIERVQLRRSRLKAQNKLLKKSNKEELLRQISLRSDIEYLRGYVKGLDGNPDNTLKRQLFDRSYRNSRFIQGYHAGFYERNQTVRINNYITGEFKFEDNKEACKNAPIDKVNNDGSDEREPDELSACL